MQQKCKWKWFQKIQVKLKQVHTKSFVSMMLQELSGVLQIMHLNGLDLFRQISVLIGPQT